MVAVHDAGESPAVHCSANLGLRFSGFPPDLDQIRRRANKKQRIERSVYHVHQAEDEFGKCHEESDDALLYRRAVITQ
jgi:hypothetical protein